MLLVNSFPKSGTNMVQAMLQMSAKFVGHFGMYDDSTGQMYPHQAINQVLGSFPVDYNNFATCHMHWRADFQDALEEAGIKMILLLRDPRDVIVSHAHYVANTPAHSLHKMYKELSYPQRLWTSMKGALDKDPNFPDIGNRLLPYLGWINYGNCRVMTYEEIIRDPQARSFEMMEFWQGIKSKMVAKSMAGVIGMPTPTMREGKTGAWEDEFTQDMKDYYSFYFGWIHYLIRPEVKGWKGT